MRAALATSPDELAVKTSRTRSASVCQRVCLVLGEGRPVIVALEHRTDGISLVADRRRLYGPGAVMPRCQRVDQTARDVGNYP